MYGTALENAVSFNDVEAQVNFALILGNEGEGVNPDLLKETTQNLTIPIYGKAESLNVAIAGSILMYQLKGWPLMLSSTIIMNEISKLLSL